MTATETTTAGKRHFDVLDGLRGTAALLVVLFHIQGIAVSFQHDKLILPHAYLAVDFFFALSGYVIGYAYDDRRNTMSKRELLLARIIRLHPLVVLGAILGLLSYVFDPFHGGQQTVALSSLVVVFLLTLFVLPAPTLPNRWEDTHPLNGPLWTLLQEYLASIAYVLFLRHMAVRSVLALAAVALVALLVGALYAGSLDVGYAWNNLWGAPVRLAQPFLAGLLVYRLRDRLTTLRLGFVPLSVAMVVLFAFPSLPKVGNIALNAVYDFLVVAIAFPMIVALGAKSESSPALAGIGKWFGWLSYPIYVTHFPIAYTQMNLAVVQKASANVLAATAIGLFLVMLVVAMAAAKFWDEPLRRWLRRALMH